MQYNFFSGIWFWTLLLIAVLIILDYIRCKPKHCHCGKPISSPCNLLCADHCKICYLTACRGKCVHQPEFDSADYPYWQCKMCLYRRLNCTQGECMTCVDGSGYVESLLAEQDGVD